MGNSGTTSAHKKADTKEQAAQASASTADKAEAETFVLPAEALPHKKKLRLPQKWPQLAGFIAGALALVAIAAVGTLGQYYKGKTMPNVIVAGQAAGTKNQDELKKQLEAQRQSFAVTFQVGEKELQPNLEEIGVAVDVNKTVDHALKAKRDQGLSARITFWRTYEVPVVTTVNKTLLTQYLENNGPELVKPPQDAQLTFDPANGSFTITNQADGEGPNVEAVKQSLQRAGEKLEKATVAVKPTKRAPAITEASLNPLLEPANELVTRRIVLTGLGYSYRATPSDVASWVTPTPQDDGSLSLVIDKGKIQSYVEGIGRKISQQPVDKKVVKDPATGNEVVLQEGRDGTELADKEVLANAIAQALKDGRDSEQAMNIQTAAHKVVNMDSYDKWIEVDLSEQRTTAYERATPIRNFIISSGKPGTETVVGEFEIWLKVRRQTMTGGSRASGDYYSIPNVEWVSYFYKDYALHGAWWRDSFGTPGSRGCVNMRNEDAQWLWNWAPMGTKVIVHY